MGLKIASPKILFELPTAHNQTWWVFVYNIGSKLKLLFCKDGKYKFNKIHVHFFLIKIWAKSAENCHSNANLLTGILLDIQKLQWFRIYLLLVCPSTRKDIRSDKVIAWKSKTFQICLWFFSRLFHINNPLIINNNQLQNINVDIAIFSSHK